MEANRKRTQLQAYFAGIVDGEGTLGIARTNKTNSFAAHVRVKMTDPEAVILLNREYPEGQTLIERRVNGWQNCYLFNLSHYKADRFLQDVFPFLIVKQEQAQVVLSFLAHRRRDHQIRGPKAAKGNTCQRCTHLHDQIREIRKRGKGVNSVNALLDHGLREYRAKREDVEQDVAYGVALLSSLEGVETSAEGSTTQ